jgi:transcriptional regulator
MYRPKPFREDRPEVLEAFIQNYPLGALIAISTKGLVANHIPMIGSYNSNGRFCLRGHIARANDLWRLVDNPAPVMVIFGGAHHYITPSWYPSKHATGQGVPNMEFLRRATAWLDPIY